MNASFQPSPSQYLPLQAPLTVLDADLVQQLDAALVRVGAFGEVRLVIVKGRIRFIQTMQSESILNTPPDGKER